MSLGNRIFSIREKNEIANQRNEIQNCNLNKPSENETEKTIPFKIPLKNT